MKSALIVLFAGASLAVACGSSQPATFPATTGSDSHGKHGHGHHDRHAGLSPALREFHHVLGPVWHTDGGPQRVEKACASSKAMQEKAVATGDAELIATTKELDAACAKEGKADVEAKLKGVHERFHAIAKVEKHEDEH